MNKKQFNKEFFIKGLFINHTQLIFVELEKKEAEITRGYAFNDIKDTGRYSLYD